MGRGQKPTKGKAKPSVARKSPKDEGARVRDLEKRLAEARERERATGEILRVISSSPTDLQPVFDAIVQSAQRLLRAHTSSVFRRLGDEIHLAAYTRTGGAADAAFASLFPMSFDDYRKRFPSAELDWVDGTVIQVPDFDHETGSPANSDLARARGFRSLLQVPMRQAGHVIGLLRVTRVDAGAFADDEITLLQTFADQAVIAIENVRLFKELESRNRDLTTALDQRTATAEILRVISSSPTNVQPTFEAIAESATRLCGAVNGLVFRFDGELIHVAAHHNIGGAELDAILSVFPIRPGRGSVAGRAIESRRIVHVEDLEQDPEYDQTRVVQAGFRTALSVPMLRGGVPIGTINVMRMAVAPFSPSQIALLQTFADQAVIAIENVRLFTELQEKNQALTQAHAQVSEALEQQTATAEILRAISQSPTDYQPVFDTIVRNAAEVCAAHDAVLALAYGEDFIIHAQHGPIGAPIGVRYPMRDTAGGLAVKEGRLVHVENLAEAAEFPVGRDIARRDGHRTTLCVPLLREGLAMGTIMARRAEVRPFTDAQIALLQTFADQAVIAIENVRLFKELETRNRDLTEALDQQTATSDILKVIASTPTDLTPVFETILRSAVRLFNAYGGSIRRFDGKLVHLAAVTSPNPEADDRLRRMFPHPPDREYAAERPILDGTVAHIPDTEDEPSELTRRLARDFGFRRVLGVPMLREGQIVGVLNVTGSEPEPYSARQIALLQTFADQAVIAIENVRLFTELQEKNRAVTQAHAQVTEALDQQRATSEILEVISRSPTDVQPVFDAIVRSAAALCHAPDVIINIAEDDSLRMAASVGSIAASVGQSPLVQRGLLPLTRGLVSGRAFIDRRTVHVHDVSAMPDDEFPAAKALQKQYGGRGTTLAIPLLRENVPLGVLTLVRNEVAPFTERQVALLETFADQAVIAIENVRLFKELEARNRDLTQALEQQTATSEILSVISSSPTDEKPVFDAIARSSVQLCAAAFAVVASFDGELLNFVAGEHVGTEGRRTLAAVYPMRPHRGQLAGRAILDRAVVHVADVMLDPEYVGASLGNRATLSVPMLRTGAPIGTITIARFEPVPFTEQEIALLQTFADQAVIAIENVRLFTELQASNKDLREALDTQTATSDILRVISKSPTDLQPVFDPLLDSAVRLCGATDASLYRLDGDVLHHVAARGAIQGPRPVGTTGPIPHGTAPGRAILTGETVQVMDAQAEVAGMPPEAQNYVRRAGARTVLAVPLLREGSPIGVIVVRRTEVRPFAENEMRLLRTFADQAVIAIENVRLFKELEAANRELAAASHHKSEFLANMSHELRTPLNAIIGFSEVLAEKMFGELNEKQEEYSKDIHASGQHLLSLINDILDLSKIEAGRMELELSDFHLPTALDSALTLVRERAGRRSIALHLSVDERLGQIQADERKVRQVVLNLLSNAIKFTPEGGRIEVGAVPKDGLAEVSITDTGIGIAPEDQEAVFEEFRQVGTADKKVEGTGLGLTLCRKFVELHGGKIWVKSEVGVGSTFTFTIALRRGE